MPSRRARSSASARRRKSSARARSRTPARLSRRQRLSVASLGWPAAISAVSSAMVFAMAGLLLPDHDREPVPKPGRREEEREGVAQANALAIDERHRLMRLQATLA